MAIENEELAQEAREKIERGVFRLEAKEVAGVGLMVDAKDAEGRRRSERSTEPFGNA